MTDHPGQTPSQDNAVKIFLQYINFVQYVAMINAPDPSLHNDIVNDAFITFTSKAEEWDLSTPKPLLRKIVENIAKRYWRERNRTLPKTLAKIAEHLSRNLLKTGLAETDNQYELEMKALELCLAQLSEEQLKLIRVHYFDGMSLVDFAGQEQCNLNTLYSTLTRIRLLLRKCVENALRGGTNHE